MAEQNDMPTGNNSSGKVPDYTPPDQVAGEALPTPPGTPPVTSGEAGKDEYEGGMIPVQEPVPQETLDAQAAAAMTRQVAADGIKSATDTDVLAALAKEGVTLEDVKKMLADSVNAHSAEITALRQELQSVKTAGSDGMIGQDASVGGMPWMYWRCPNSAGFKASGRAGWITYAPGGPTPKGARDTGSYATYLKKGMVPVTQYGYLAPPTKPQAYLDSFLTILQAPGGSAEFPASQVIAYGWHLKPPIKGMVFEQYEALKGTIKHWQCEACGERRFFMPDDTEIGGVYRTHLMVDHKYPFREAAEAIKLAGYTASPYAPATVEQMMARTSPE